MPGSEGIPLEELGELLFDECAAKKIWAQATTPPFNSSSTFSPKLAGFTPIALIILL
jgi:hypothetical protein